MCYGCWEEAGKPVIDTPAVRAAAQAAAEVYEHACTGGNLHIVLDDWNIEDSNLEFCSQCIDGAGVMPLGGSTFAAHLRYNEEKQANPDPPEQLAVERCCCDLFMALTEEERASALALNDGFWSSELPPADDAIDPHGPVPKTDVKLSCLAEPRAQIAKLKEEPKS